MACVTFSPTRKTLKTSFPLGSRWRRRRWRENVTRPPCTLRLWLNQRHGDEGSVSVWDEAHATMIRGLLRRSSIVLNQTKHSRLSRLKMTYQSAFFSVGSFSEKPCINCMDKRPMPFMLYWETNMLSHSHCRIRHLSIFLQTSSVIDTLGWLLLISIVPFLQTSNLEG